MFNPLLPVGVLHQRVKPFGCWSITRILPEAGEDQQPARNLSLTDANVTPQACHTTKRTFISAFKKGGVL